MVCHGWTGVCTAWVGVSPESSSEKGCQGPASPGYLWSDSQKSSQSLKQALKMRRGSIQVGGVGFDPLLSL